MDQRRTHRLVHTAVSRCVATTTVAGAGRLPCRRVGTRLGRARTAARAPVCDRPGAGAGIGGRTAFAAGRDRARAGGIAARGLCHGRAVQCAGAVGGMVRTPSVGAHPSLHPGAIAPRDRTGVATRLRALSVQWQHLDSVSRVAGPDALAGVVGQLEGFEAPALLWESELLPARVRDYQPAWLDELCTAGRTVWARLRPGGGRSGAALRATPIVLLPRREAQRWSSLARGVDDTPLAQRSAWQRCCSSKARCSSMRSPMPPA